MTPTQPEPYTGNWTPSDWFLAQSAHVGWAGFAVSLTAVHGVNPWWMVLAIAVVSAAKEFWADRAWLEHDTLSGSLQDFAFYQAGSLVARLAIWWLWPGAVLLALLMLGLTVWDFESQQPQGLP